MTVWQIVLLMVCPQACTSLPVDLICLDLGKRLPFRLKPPLLQAALARGVHFEVSDPYIQQRRLAACSYRR